MKDKLGLYVSNLMATIIDDDERNFSRKLALNELQKELQEEYGDKIVDIKTGELKEHESGKED